MSLCFCCYSLFLNELQVHIIGLIIFLVSKYMFIVGLYKVLTCLFIIKYIAALSKNEIGWVLPHNKSFKTQWLQVTMIYWFVILWADNSPGLTWVIPLIWAGLAG